MGVWCWRLYENNHTHLIGVKFRLLHQAPQHIDETATLILRQWPGPVADDGEAEHNYIRTSSLQESSDQFPCHLIAVFQNRVVAHCVVRALPPKVSRSKFKRMLKAGLPLAAAKQAAELVGLDPSFLEGDHSDEHAQHNEEQEALEVTVASLVVTPEMRGRGLGKAMCGFAARKASELGGAKQVTFSCRNALVQFYERLGCRKRTGLQRPGVPKVRLGNELYIEIDEQLLHKAEEMIYHFSC